MESLKAEISELIDKLHNRFHNLPEGALHPIDADLMLSVLRELYEKVEILKSLKPVELTVKADPLQYAPPVVEKVEKHKDTPVEIPPVAPDMVPPVVEPPAPAVQPEIVHSNQPHFGSVPPKEVPAPVKSDFHAEHEFARDSGTVANKPLKPSADLFAMPSISDVHKNDLPSVNDKVNAGKNDLTLADQMLLKPIHDIKSAIGINEKFQFINELFNGSAELYNESVNLLNNCSDRVQAEQLLAEMSTRFAWDEQHAVLIRLREFVTRRYLTADK
ncbi:MAG: hypothetical protein M9948_08010 [Lentimicrobium sp.]|nr:hypothetical protein [Lentimicrobium sp.]